MKDKILIDKKILTGIFRSFGDNRPDRFIELGKEVAKLFYDNGDEECALFVLAQLEETNSFTPQIDNAVGRPKVIHGKRKDTAPFLSSSVKTNK